MVRLDKGEMNENELKMLREKMCDVMNELRKNSKSFKRMKFLTGCMIVFNLVCSVIWIWRGSYYLGGFFSLLGLWNLHLFNTHVDCLARSRGQLYDMEMQYKYIFGESQVVEFKKKN
jgi:hypothetical protein